MIVISDLHLGMQRSGGTTPSSAYRLRQYAIGQYKRLLMLDPDVVVNGDFFDSYNVPMADMLAAYFATSHWLADDPGRRLWLLPGNHDKAKNSANLSGFEFMGRLLVSHYPGRVLYKHESDWITKDVYAIPHVLNQETFNLELKGIPEGVRTLLVHANYDNPFASQADHSLNLSREQAKEITKRGITIVMGHEHQGRTLMNDKLIIVGNQFPGSVSDCLGNDHKFALSIDGDDMELVPTWSRSAAEGDYAEADWESLQGVEADFIRVTGTATAAQAAEVIKTISKFRQRSDAFVVSNAVKVEGVGDMADLAQSVEDIRTVNVIDLLLSELDAEQRTVITKLLEEQ